MARYINIADSKGRNASIVFGGKTTAARIKTVTAQGEPVKTIRVLKRTANNSYEALLKRYGSAEAISGELIAGDPEIDLLLTGRIINSAGRVYVDEDLRPVFRITKKERVYFPDGTLKEERTPKETVANIMADVPIRPSGKLFPKKDIYNKFVFTKKYQLKHINGLTFDFLFEMARELHEKESLMLIGAGPKGTDPLVFQDGGKPYRAFLEGRVKGDSYLLIVHLTNLELKPVV